MGIFHCLDSACAEVRYQPYKTTKGIRYRYPGKDWVTVDGDDYRCDERLLLNSSWRIACNFSFVYYGLPGIYTIGFNRFIYENGDTIQANTVFGGSRPELAFRGEVISSELLPAENNASVIFLVTTLFEGKEETEPYFFEYKPTNGNLRLGLAWLLEDPSPYSGAGTDTEPSIEFTNNDGTKPRKVVVFSVTKNGEEIFSREADVCPEVEILNDECKLSDRTEVIKIEKIPFLERVEVTDYDYQNDRNGVRRVGIPDNCLVVRNNQSTAIPPLSENFPSYSNSALGADFTYGFIKQICSDEGCPPPEYEVICNCEGEKCPSGTCPKQCGNVVCCYNTNSGKSEAEIPIENYSGGGI